MSEEINVVIGERALLKICMKKYSELAAVVCRCTPEETNKISHREIIKAAESLANPGVTNE